MQQMQHCTSVYETSQKAAKESPKADRNTALQTQKGSTSLRSILDRWQEVWNETKSELQTFLCAVLLRGRWHWVSCSGEGAHYWQRAGPVIPGPAAGDWSEFQNHFMIVKVTISLDVKRDQRSFSYSVKNIILSVWGSFHSWRMKNECQGVK